MNKKYFLALTAIESFWDKSRSMVFLSPACLRYTRRHVLKGLDYKVIDYPFKAPDELYEAKKYISSLYDKVLFELFKQLNVVHQVNYPKYYWEVLIGHWLHLFLVSTYDRYISIQKAKKEYPNFETVGLNNDSFVIPENFKEFSALLQGDEYNLQIYTQLLKMLNYHFITKKLKVRRVPFLRKLSLKEKASQFCNYFMKRIARKKAIFAVASYFPGQTTFRLFLKSRGKIVFLYPLFCFINQMKKDKEKRDIIRSLVYGHNEFESILPDLIAQNILSTYIEKYKKIISAVEKYYPSQPRTILSAGAWHGNEFFQHWAATSKYMHNTVLLGIQHGGKYGILKEFPPEQR